MGAKYDGRMKSWYVPANIPIIIFNKFIPLTIELIPSSNWKNNVRTKDREVWTLLRKGTYREAKNTCCICNKKSFTEDEPLEAHEVWEYDLDTKTQKLKTIYALCHKCHRTKHYGLALAMGEGDIAKKHILKVNKWKEEDLRKYFKEILNDYDNLVTIPWKLDISRAYQLVLS